MAAERHPADIINTALIELREKTITRTQYDAETTVDAPVSVRRVWEYRRAFLSTLAETLRKHNWSCVSKRVALTKDETNEPAWGYSNRFPLPDDFMRLIGIYKGGIATNFTTDEISNVGGEKYRIETLDIADEKVKSIITGYSAINIRYVYMPKDANGDFDFANEPDYLDRLDFSLLEAIRKELVRRLTYNATGSTTYTELNYGIARQSLDDAKFEDSHDDGPEDIDSCDLINVRF